MAEDGHWMEKAFGNSHGQFKAKAKKAGMSTGAFAKKEAASPTASTKTKRQANLAKLGAKYGGGHVKTPPPDHPRNPGPYQDNAHSQVPIGAPHKMAMPHAGGAHGFGHAAHVRSGHLRNSGTPGAHRIGKR